MRSYFRNRQPPEGPPISNVLTSDIEDWRPLADEWIHGIRTEASGWVPRQVEHIRRILDRHNTRATFFWLGCTAQSHPPTVLALALAGPANATTCYAHPA